jgi:hypothetical protein
VKLRPFVRNPNIYLCCLPGVQKNSMKIKSDYLDLDNENLITQRFARNMVKRDSVIIFILYSIDLSCFLYNFIIKNVPYIFLC